MNNNQENRLVYRIISALFVTLVVAIIIFDMSGKYFQNNIAIFSITSPLIFPFLVLVVLFICTIFEWGIIIKRIRQAINKLPQKETIQQTKSPFLKKEMLNMSIFIILSLLYILILPKLHFIYSTSIYMFCIMVVINEQDKLAVKAFKALLATAITIPIIYYIFYGIFVVILP